VLGPPALRDRMVAIVAELGARYRDAAAGLSDGLSGGGT